MKIVQILVFFALFSTRGSCYYENSFTRSSIGGMIKYSVGNTLASWKKIQKEVEDNHRRLMDDKDDQTTSESLATAMYSATVEGMDRMVDLMAQAEHIEVYQSEGDEPNQDFLDILAVAKLDLEKYEKKLTENLAIMSSLETNEFDRAKINQLQIDANSLFSVLFQDLVLVNEAEEQISAGGNDLEVLQKLQASLENTFAHILAVLSDLSPAEGNLRRILLAKCKFDSGESYKPTGEYCLYQSDCTKTCSNVDPDCLDNECVNLSTDRSCFSSEATVEVLGKGKTAMKNLAVGDRILTGNAIYEPVYAFGHIDRTKTTKFLQIFTSNIKNPLEVTSGHFLKIHVMVQGKNVTHAVTASEIKVGDILYGSDKEQKVVTKIKSISRDGLYAPFTASGNIIVNGIEASTYASILKSKNGVGSIRTLYLSENQFIHIYLAPFRLLCLGVSTIFGNYHTENGLSLFVELGIFFSKFYNSNIFVYNVVLPLAVLLWFPIYAFESVVGASYAPLVLLIIVVTSLTIRRRTNFGGIKKVKVV